MSKIKKIVTLSNACEVLEKLYQSYIISRNVKCHSHFGRQLAASYKIKHVIITESNNCTLVHLFKKTNKKNVCTHTKMFTIAFFITMPNWKESPCSSTNWGALIP